MPRRNGWLAPGRYWFNGWVASGRYWFNGWVASGRYRFNGWVASGRYRFNGWVASGRYRFNGWAASGRYRFNGWAASGVFGFYGWLASGFLGFYRWLASGFLGFYRWLEGLGRSDRRNRFGRWLEGLSGCHRWRRFEGLRRRDGLLARLIANRVRSGFLRWPCVSARIRSDSTTPDLVAHCAGVLVPWRSSRDIDADSELPMLPHRPLDFCTQRHTMRRLGR